MSQPDDRRPAGHRLIPSNVDVDQLIFRGDYIEALINIRHQRSCDLGEALEVFHDRHQILWDTRRSEFTHDPGEIEFYT